MRGWGACAARRDPEQCIPMIKEPRRAAQAPQPHRNHHSRPYGFPLEGRRTQQRRLSPIQSQYLREEVGGAEELGWTE